MSMELDHAKVDWIKNLKEMSQEQSTAKQAAEIIAQADEETRCIFAESLSQKAAGSEISVLESLLTDLEESVRYNACLLYTSRCV